MSCRRQTPPPPLQRRSRREMKRANSVPSSHIHDPSARSGGRCVCGGGGGGGGGQFHGAPRGPASLLLGAWRAVGGSQRGSSALRHNEFSITHKTHYVSRPATVLPVYLSVALREAGWGRSVRVGVGREGGLHEGVDGDSGRRFERCVWGGNRLR